MLPCSKAMTSTPVSGVCDENMVNGCSSGSLSDVSDNSSHYLWTCNGQSGGGDASCTKSKTVKQVQQEVSPVNSVCDENMVNGCSSGSLSDVSDGSVLAAPEFIDKNLGEYFYKFYLDENKDGSTNRIYLGTVTAEDDQGRPFKYYIEGIGNYWGNKKFEIDPNNGKLYYKGTGENHEKGSAPGNHGFSFEIRAKVDGSNINPNCHQSNNCGYAYIDIGINNVDEPPIFSRSSYTFNLKEGLDGSQGLNGGQSVYVGKVSASDQDARFYSESLTYSIAEGNTNKFSINSRTGRITYAGSGETYSPNKEYNLVVNATDSTSLNASVNVTIRVKQ